MIRVSLARGCFEIGSALARLEALGGGAVASFAGVVRGDGGVEALDIEHWPGRTERALEALAGEGMRRFGALGVELVHRVGVVPRGERIVFVGTAATHRAAALDSCAYLIDRLKTDAPFWKREELADGGRRWVEAREGDGARSAGWR